MKTPRFWYLIILSALAITALACGITFNTPKANDQNAIALTVQAIQQSQTAASAALPPTAAAPTQAPSEVQPTIGPTAQPGTPSPTPLPCNKPKFISETIPDGTSMGKGEPFTKTWRIRNDGTCTWTNAYKWVFISGDKMHGPAYQNLAGSIAPGQTATINVDLSAPTVDGLYTGYWKLQSDQGEQFGNYWVQVRVGPPPAPFAVTSVIFNVHPNIDMACPGNVSVKAEITSSNAGKVTYYWKDSAGGVSANKSITFDAAGKKIVDYKATIAASGDYTAKVYIDAPNHQWFGPVDFHVNCTP